MKRKQTTISISPDIEIANLKKENKELKAELRRIEGREKVWRGDVDRLIAKLRADIYSYAKRW